MSRSVGILTLPMHTNYGGIVQAAALSQFMIRNGHEVVLLNKLPWREPWKRALISALKVLPGQNIGGIRAREAAISKHHGFIARCIPRTSRVARSKAELSREVARLDLGAVVVGSDQVWRFDYFADPQCSNYFLDFVEDGCVRKISYAASFGSSSWQYPERSEEFSRLLQDFDAVSVREDSGVEICRDALGRGDAVHVLDPTMLMDRGFYEELAAESSPESRGTLLTYVLDETDLTQAALDHLSAKHGVNHPVRRLPVSGGAEVLPDIPTWLRAFLDAEFIITDSFHGTVFSILFGKKFLTIPNRGRGIDRFTSLLGQLGLEDRLLTSDDADVARAIADQEIDYCSVWQKLDVLREHSASFLLSALDPREKTSAA